MKTSTIVSVVVALVVLAGAGYWYTNMREPLAQETQEPSEQTPGTTTQTPPIAQVGGRCGGNMMNAPVCATGSHCAPDPASHLPFGDVGGTCVADSAAAYVAGNLLLGADTNATLGKYLIGFNGMTLYTYAKDTTGVSNCSGQCAANWPPYTVPSTDVLTNIQAGVSGKVGSIARADGTMQVTYNGKPLYFYVVDKKSGDTAGQNVGSVWFVVKP